MPLEPMLIAPFATGLDTDLSPWIAPPDSFSELNNAHIRHGIVEKRAGLRLFGTLGNDRVMGISRYIAADGSQVTLAFDTTLAYRYNTTTHSFDVLDGGVAIMSGADNDFIWTVNWQATGGLNRLYFTNGKAFDTLGGMLDGIRYYDNTAATTTSFVPDLNTAGTRKLYGCKHMFILRQRLLVLNTYEFDGVSANHHPQRMRWCEFQNPGNWNDITRPGGGFVDAGTGEQIISARQLQNEIIVFFTDSVWKIIQVPDPAKPFKWVRINNFRACNAKMGSVGYDRYVVGIGNRGITGSDSNQTSRIDDRIQDFVVDDIEATNFDKVFCARDYQNKKFWTLFPGTDSDENNSALIYDDDSKSYSTYSVSLNCLGYGNASQDYSYDDFTSANELDWTYLDAGDAQYDSFYVQENSEIFLGGDIEGNVFILEKGGDDNDITISSEMTSAAWNPYVKDGIEAQLSYIDLYVESHQSTKAIIEFYKNSEFAPYASQQFDFLPNLGWICAVQNISQSNPANVNAADHGLSTGDKIYIYGAEGMEKINSLQYTITVVDPNNFTLDGIDSTAADFDPYTTGAGVYLRPFYRERIWKRAYAGGIGNEHRIRITSEGKDRPFQFHAFKPYFKPRGKRSID